MMHAPQGDKIKYPTQKPFELLQRLLGMVVKKGDVVADFFHGSGSTMLAAESLNCRYLGCDVSTDAISITRNRLRSNNIQAA
jgi:DNA modification methylase